jgi:phosphoglycerate dehydrogenase-like enzyme
MRLLIYEPSYRRLEAEILALGPVVEPLVMAPSGEVTLHGQPVPAEQVGAEAAWTNADVFFGSCARTFMVAMLKSPGLKWVQSGAAGFDNAVFGQIVQKGAALTTSHGQAVGMAEYVLWGVLDALQNGQARRARQADRIWERVSFREINGSRWLIVGFGAIGRGVADRARAFGAHITGVRRNLAADDSADRIVAQAEIPNLLPESDVVVLCCPLTAETRHLANDAFFRAMKPGAVLVNVGRGGLVDEPALLAALARGVPEHAVLDVFETEPLPAESPFWAHPRVTLTPHASGSTEGQGTRNDQLFLENIRRYVSGEPLLNIADPRDVLAGR